MSSATVTLDEERMEEPGSLGPGLLEALWRYRVGVAIATLSAALLGFAISSLQMPEYAATARLLLADPEGGRSSSRPISATRRATSATAPSSSPRGRC